MALDLLLAKAYEEARDKLLLRLRQESTKGPAYGGPMVQLYPEEGRHGGLFLMANGELVDLFLMQGYPGPSTPDAFVLRYVFDFHKNEYEHIEAGYVEIGRQYDEILDEAVYPLPSFPQFPQPGSDHTQFKAQVAEFWRASEERKKDPRYIAFIQKSPLPPTLSGFLAQQAPQSLLDEALREGAKLMTAALEKETYRQLGFVQVSADQIKKVIE